MKKKTAVLSVFLMEQYLKDGVKHGGKPSKKETTRIVREYGLVRTGGAYYGDREAIFSIFQDKYPRADKFNSYIDLFLFVKDLPEPYDVGRVTCGRKKPCYDTGLHVGKWGFFKDDDIGEDMNILADNLNWDFT